MRKTSSSIQPPINFSRAPEIGGGGCLDVPIEQLHQMTEIPSTVANIQTDPLQIPSPDRLLPQGAGNPIASSGHDLHQTLRPFRADTLVATTTLDHDDRQHTLDTHALLLSLEQGVLYDLGTFLIRDESSRVPSKGSDPTLLDSSLSQLAPICGAIDGRRSRFLRNRRDLHWGRGRRESRGGLGGS